MRSSNQAGASYHHHHLRRGKTCQLFDMLPVVEHEAAVGKISEEEVAYLMARGLTRTEATATIVRVFSEQILRDYCPNSALSYKGLLKPVKGKSCR